MNTKIKTLIIVLAVLSNGCVSDRYRTAVVDNNQLKKEIDSYTVQQDSPKVSFVTTSYIDASPYKQVVPSPKWLETPVSIDVTNQPVSSLLTYILKDTDVEVVYDEGVKLNKPITVTSSGSRETVLNAIAKQADYGVNFTDSRLTMTAFVSDTFNINLPSGVYSGQLGTSESENKSDGDTGGEPKIDGQFLSVAYRAVDVFNEIQKGIESIISTNKESSVQSVPSLSLINVRTTPSRMAEVRNFVNIYQEKLGKQAVFDVRVIEFSSNLGQEQGIDWNIVREIGDGTLQFFIPSTSTISDGAGYGLSFMGKGKWDGTTAFIKALESQGSVTTSTPITGLVLNHQPAKISQTNTTPFTSEINTDVSEGVVSTEIKRDKVSVGVDLMLTPNIMDDYVWLRISGKLSKITKDKTETYGDNSIRFIDTQESEINFTNKLRYGQTYVIASVKQKRILNDKLASFGFDFLGGHSSLNEVTETLVLLTPRRAD
ncbi:hypothetical protein ABT56_18825 [Photobacterium aquae]|uniref:Type II/III secretion system secretin-like domain-containing protein n=1 Tax=Photobacterium aquae TaxID=1195763 RepID=A0A0J1GV33_9GAMM|nr:hypothetical protein [Photobacterium aquae]KLV03491.1 hypothetical protein ABT56_18825 [Photobacterium aquae]